MPEGTPSRGPVPGWPAPPDQGPARGRGSVATTATLVLALAGVVAAAVGLGIQLLPRHFTPAQQRKIMAWEIAGRWRDVPAGRIFPGTVSYGPPKAIGDDGTSLTLTARRLGLARQASCEASGSAATDPTAVAVLARNGCEAVLRATYTDGTDTYVATVGVVPFPSAARAAAARGELSAKGLRMSGGRTPGVRVVPVAGTPAAGFTDSHRQLAANVVAGPYLVMYTVGYADGRPLVPVSADNYADAEMTSFGQGVAASAAAVLGAPPPLPHCPGAPGC